MKNEPLQFGEEPPRDWRDHAETPDAKKEHEDSEDANQDEKEFVAATLGFNPAELFKAKLPTDQAVASAYKIYDAGKTRAQLVSEVKARLKDKGTKKNAKYTTDFDLLPEKHPKATK